MTFSWYPLLATPICLGAWKAAGRMDRESTDREEEAMEAVDRSRVADLIILFNVVFGIVVVTVDISVICNGR